MNKNEDSSFLQGVESRLDSLFGEATGAPHAKDPNPAETVAEDVAFEPAPDAQAQEDIEAPPVAEDPDLGKLDRTAPAAEDPVMAIAADSDKGQPQDKSTFIAEIEKRFSAIFGEEDKDIVPEETVSPRQETQEVSRPPEPVEPVQDSQDDDEFLTPAASIYNSPLKDIKSIVLSIEWEISEDILSQFDDEINRLYLLYTGNRITQGFLRILRFLGRYIRVRGARSNQDSINLLLSVYDQLETVMVSEGMTEARKHIILIENIKKYRKWVENTDIETEAELSAQKIDLDEAAPFVSAAVQSESIEEPRVATVMDIPEVTKAAVEEPLEALPSEKTEETRRLVIEDVEPLVLESREEKFTEPVVEAVEAIDEIAAQEEPPAEAIPEAIEKAVEEAPSKIDFAREDRFYDIQEPVIFSREAPGASALPEEPMSSAEDDIQKTFAEAMKNMPPHEAYAAALAEMKRTFQGQLDLLKEEIRTLKGERQA